MQTYPSGNLAQTLLVPRRRGLSSDILLPSHLPVEQLRSEWLRRVGAIKYGSGVSEPLYMLNITVLLRSPIGYNSKSLYVLVVVTPCCVEGPPKSMDASWPRSYPARVGVICSGGII